MPMFRIIGGPERHGFDRNGPRDVNGHRAIRTYRVGDTMESFVDLAALHPDKFVRVPDPVPGTPAPAAPVPAPVPVGTPPVTLASLSMKQLEELAIVEGIDLKGAKDPVAALALIVAHG